MRNPKVDWAKRGLRIVVRLCVCGGLVVAGGVCFLAGERSAGADIYTFVDKNGVVHYTNDPAKAKGRRAKRIYKRVRKRTLRPKKGSRKDLIPARDRSKDRFTRYDAYIRGASRLYKIPIPLIKAVIRVESDFDPRVVSCKGAKGLMQMMPETAKDMGVVNVFDPRENIYGGTRYLRVLANMFNGDLVLTVAAHHAGPGAVKRYRSIPPYRTTRIYVRKVLLWYYKYRHKRSAATRSARRRSVRRRSVHRRSARRRSVRNRSAASRKPTRPVSGAAGQP